MIPIRFARKTLAAGAIVLASAARAGEGPAIVGLDHIPVAVRDLARAETTFHALGFATKPGRVHANGIQNTHVKFANGSEIELLSALHDVDEQSGRYVTHLRAGEGPAFVAFHARDTERLHAALRAGGHRFRHEGPVTRLLAPEFDYLFLVRDNRSPTDRPEHFAHPNGATTLRAVWIATEHEESLVRLLVGLGGRPARRRVPAPDTVEATVVTLAEGEVYVLPKQHQRVAGRPVLGASVQVHSLARVRWALARGRIASWRGDTERVLVEPGAAHGLWLEFRR